MTQYIQNFIKFRPLLKELVTRDIKTKYRRSVLGVLWTLLNPLLMMIVLSIVFSNLFRFRIENYPLYILSGQLIYNFFSEGTSRSMSAVIDNASLIKKVYIPKYLFAFSRILSSFINLMASFCALIIVMIFTDARLYYTTILAIIPIFLLTVFATGIGLILAAVAVKFRDMIHLYGVLLVALNYLAPIIYPMSILPGKINFLVRLNPITQVLNVFREVVIYGQLPSAGSVLYSLVMAVIALVVGLYVFYKNQDNFILNL